MDAPLLLRHPDSRSILRLEPSYGCVATSWTVGASEILALPAPIEEFLVAERTGGIPLLYPYANRLRANTFTVCGRKVDLSGVPGLKRDGTGLPMHGLLLRWSRWKVTVAADGASATASIDWAAEPALFAAFPFAHTLEVHWRLGGDAERATLEVTTTVRADRAEAVPIAFGWHPYFRVDNAASARVTVPNRRRVALLSSGVPEIPLTMDGESGESEMGVGGGDDALFQLVESSSDQAEILATMRDGHRELDLCFNEGCRWMQIFSPIPVPARAPFISLEPMAAPTSALTDGCATVIAPGEEFTMRWRLRVRDQPSASSNASSNTSLHTGHSDRA